MTTPLEMILSTLSRLQGKIKHTTNSKYSGTSRELLQEAFKVAELLLVLEAQEKKKDFVMLGEDKLSPEVFNDLQRELQEELNNLCISTVLSIFKSQPAVHPSVMKKKLESCVDIAKTISQDLEATLESDDTEKSKWRDSVSSSNSTMSQERGFVA